jgi:hypothetical protein
MLNIIKKKYTDLIEEKTKKALKKIEDIVNN